MGKSKIRKIVVDNIDYYWSVDYDELYGSAKCTIGLVKQRNHCFSFYCGIQGSNHDCCITHYRDEINDIESITPSLIREAIEFANKRVNWQHTKSSHIKFDAQGFTYPRKYPII